ncbi:MAG: glycoside hydrolase family 2 TIM barrel-domain containing protein [Firmicutes bacterium]|nr:glycoside hydrolase family 2 TIM barrel-domain containing protein [Bacillota bacterium]MDD4693494.1 glycoside hydrolase family 2 TIM barrel-domain containing protein [Bacillota bacterium]
MIPRPEHPRPDLLRKDWQNLNGIWGFRFDFGESGYEEEAFLGKGFDLKINVPFAPESKLSGIGYTGFMNSVWYKRTFTIPRKFENHRILLHFGAVDYVASVYLNGNFSGEHRGGYTPFRIDITGFLKDGENLLVLGVKDNNRLGLQPRGKQASHLYSSGCDYTRTTGIWQTVYLEFVKDGFIDDLHIQPDFNNCQVTISGLINKKAPVSRSRGNLAAQVRLGSEVVGEGKVEFSWGKFLFTIPLNRKVPWDIGQGHLYDLDLYYTDSEGSVDCLQTYFGLRALEIGDGKVFLNNRPIFQRLVLDQGYYRDGIYTAKDEALLKKDIELSLKLGFTGARMHQKVFEPRYLYYADKLGYLTWAEFGSWGLNLDERAWKNILGQWIETVKRDRNHPSIITWCPLNETYDGQDRELLKALYTITYDLDGSRPVIDTSGYVHVITDIYDTHDYIQDIESYKKRFHKKELPVNYPEFEKYEGQPYIVSEYGGIWWSKSDENNWGYGDRPKSEAEFMERLDGLTTTLLECPRVSGFCYTQLYDVEQEVNGLLDYDRNPKFSYESIHEILTKKAKIEETNQ